MYVKIHKSEHMEVVAICDEDLIGKTLEDKDIHFKISEHFYKGEKMNEQKIIELVKNANNLNLVGKETIALALKAKVVTKENIITIQGVPHAQVYA